MKRAGHLALLTLHLAPLHLSPFLARLLPVHLAAFHPFPFTFTLSPLTLPLSPFTLVPFTFAPFTFTIQLSPFHLSPFRPSLLHPFSFSPFTFNLSAFTFIFPLSPFHPFTRTRQPKRPQPRQVAVIGAAWPDRLELRRNVPGLPARPALLEEAADSSARRGQPPQPTTEEQD